MEKLGHWETFCIAKSPNCSVFLCCKRSPKLAPISWQKGADSVNFLPSLFRADLCGFLEEIQWLKWREDQDNYWSTIAGQFFQKRIALEYLNMGSGQSDQGWVTAAHTPWEIGRPQIMMWRGLGWCRRRQHRSNFLLCDPPSPSHLLSSDLVGWSFTSQQGRKLEKENAPPPHTDTAQMPPFSTCSPNPPNVKRAYSLKFPVEKPEKGEREEHWYSLIIYYALQSESSHVSYWPSSDSKTTRGIGTPLVLNTVLLFEWINQHPTELHLSSWLRAYCFGKFVYTLFPMYFNYSIMYITQYLPVQMYSWVSLSTFIRLQNYH